MFRQMFIFFWQGHICVSSHMERMGNVLTAHINLRTNRKYLSAYIVSQRMRKLTFHRPNLFPGGFEILFLNKYYLYGIPYQRCTKDIWQNIVRFCTLKSNWDISRSSFKIGKTYRWNLNAWMELVAPQQTCSQY